jgi:tRNA(Ile)-lysidine synthase
VGAAALVTSPSKNRTDWQAVAVALAAAIPAAALHRGALTRAANEKRRGATSGRWAVAFSGGADSLALLLLLWAARQQEGGKSKLVALHFDHRLRGAASTMDAQFCRRVCHTLGVACVVGRWAGAHKDASEAEARTARHGFFAREMRRRGLRLLWLAHHQDDVVETMLMRLSRGSGAGGLAAPRPVQELPDGRVYLRPLLTLKKTELMAALRRAGAVWREDQSNRQGRHFRNRIRHEVIPAWQRAAGRDALAGASLARDLLEEDDRALEAWVDQLKPLKRGVLDVRVLHGLPRAVIRRALHRWLLRVGPATDLSRQGFTLLLAAVEKGTDTRFSLGRDGFAVLRSGKLAFKKG